jgi:hypothetical protein
MNPQNAFLGRTDQPTAQEVSATLAETASIWKELLAWLDTEKGVRHQEWSSVSPKYGWALKLKTAKRTVVYLAPCKGCFQASFALGTKAVAAALKEKLPKSVVETIHQAPRYAEGTGVRLIVRKEKDLPPIKVLAAIKLEN